MILIDEAADAKLASALEVLRIAPDNSRYVYFKLAGQPPIAGLTDRIVEAARNKLAAYNPDVYLCDGGDVVILAKLLPSKDAHPFILEVAAKAGWSVSDT